jgi:hypothetical protein
MTTITAAANLNTLLRGNGSVLPQFTQRSAKACPNPQCSHLAIKVTISRWLNN